MKSRTHTWLMLFAFLFASTTFFLRPAAADEDDPPGRVARLSVARGQVSFNPAGTDDWVSAVVNRPITTGDKLWTDRDARAELHVGSAAFRLAGETGFSFLNLSDQILQVQVTEGTLNVRVRRLEQDESIEIDTPNLAFSVLRPGNYRINVNEAGDTTIITVRDGQGEVTGGGSAYTVRPGDQGYFTGTDSLNADIEPRGDDDDFDRWSNDRDLRKISMNTAAGVQPPSTARCGSPTSPSLAGPLIVTATGLGLRLGAGLGLTMRLGVSLLSTMVVGSTYMALGAGYLARRVQSPLPTFARSTRPRLLPGSGARILLSVSVWEPVSTSDGSR